MTGQVKERYHVNANGDLHGKRTLYNYDGSVVSVNNYVNGQLHGKQYNYKTSKLEKTEWHDAAGNFYRVFSCELYIIKIHTNSITSRILRNFAIASFTPPPK